MADGGQAGKPGRIRNAVDFLGDIQGMLALGRDAGILKKKEEAALAKTLDGEIGELVRQKMDYEAQLQRVKDKYYGKGVGRVVGAMIGRRIGLAKKEEHRQNIERLKKLIVGLEKQIKKAIAVDQKITSQDDALRKISVRDAKNAHANAATQKMIDALNSQITALQNERNIIVQNPSYASDVLLQTKVASIDARIGDHIDRIDQLTDKLKDDF